MPNITITKKEAMELFDTDRLEKIDTYPTKHDCHADVYVIEKDGKHYSLTLEFSYNDGIQLWGDIIATEVKPVEKTVIDWIPV
jgi:hypothetical protein